MISKISIGIVNRIPKIKLRKPHRLFSKDFKKVLDEKPELEEYLYEKICEASILKYQTEELGIDDVEYTDEVVGDE